MNIDWNTPLWLLLLPLVWFGIWQTAKKSGLLQNFAGKMQSILRTIVCTVLILALAAPSLAWQTKNGTTIFAIDRSASVKGSEEEMKAFLQEVEESGAEKEKTALLTFGKGTAIEQSPALGNHLTADFVSKTKDSGSEIGSALQTAAGLFPKNGTKRIVLLSDGNETEGDAKEQAKRLAEQGIQVDVFPLQGEKLPEVQLTKMTLAKNIHRDVQYEISMEIDSNTETNAVVRLYKGNTLIAEEEMQVHQGKNRVVFSDRTKEGGSLTYKGEIVPKTDTEKKNNHVYAYTYITDVPHILVAEQDGSGAEWEKLLQKGQAAVVRMPAESLPVTAEGLAAYDGIILADVDTAHLPKGFLAAVESYVRTVGGGLLVSGGEHAFAPGGYKGTVLEEILPVNMDLNTEGQEADLSMIMVIDHSGSMSDGRYGVTRVDMAKEAAIRSLEHFQEGDRVGVIVFDDIGEWAAEMQVVKGNEDELTEKIGKIQPAGGTSILPALQMAYEAIRKENTKQRHILLLTDGQAEQAGYEGLLQKMQDEGITLSAVAVGGDADTRLLERLARSGGGRYYFTDEFTDLPEIFAKETVLAGKEYLQNRTFYPQAKDPSAILQNIDGVPQLYGYVGTTAKSRGNIVLESDKEEPILASWQYGLGRTAVFTSDVLGNWTKDWLASEEGVEILRNTVAWTLRGQAVSDLRLTAEAGEKESTLRLEMPFSEEIKKVMADVVTADNKIHQVTFFAVSPGVYEGILDTAEEGAYTAGISIEKVDGHIERSYTGFHIGYPKEYDITMQKNGKEILTQIAEISDGRLLTAGRDVFSEEMPKAVAEKRLHTFLLLFLGDIALRRFTGVTLWLENQWEKQRQKRITKDEKQLRKADKEKMHMPKEKSKAELQQEKQKKTDNTVPKENTAEKAGNTINKLAEAKKKRKM